MRDHGGRAGPARPPRPPRRWPHLAGLVGAVVALTLAVAACGGGGKANGVASLSGATQTTSASNANSGKGSTQDKRQAALNFARCMRQHGIDLPDPQITASGIDQPLPRKAESKSPKFQAAEQACRQSLPGGDRPTPPSAQERQRALAFARCMRQHDINMPDPQITADGIGQQWPDPAERDTPKFRAAQQACERAVPPARG
jgi:hypothetical protein